MQWKIDYQTGLKTHRVKYSSTSKSSLHFAVKRVKIIFLFRSSLIRNNYYLSINRCLVFKIYSYVWKSDSCVPSLIAFTVVGLCTLWVYIRSSPSVYQSNAHYLTVILYIYINKYKYILYVYVRKNESFAVKVLTNMTLYVKCK